MKTLLTFLLLLSTTLVKSQTIILDSTLNKYVGTWRRTNNTDTVEIVLEKQTLIIPGSAINREGLFGWHRYVKNSILQQSSFQYIGTNINTDYNSTSPNFEVTLWGGNYSQLNNIAFFSVFYDLQLHKNFNLWFTLLPNSTTQASWKLTEPRGIYTGPDGLSGVFSLPKNLILTKM